MAKGTRELCDDAAALAAGARQAVCHARQLRDPRAYLAFARERGLSRRLDAMRLSSVILNTPAHEVLAVVAAWAFHEGYQDGYAEGLAAGRQGTTASQEAS